MTTLTDILIEDDRWRASDIETISEKAAQAALRHLGIGSTGYEIAVLACDDARISELNAEFRAKPTPTNVLSWPSFELAAEKEGATPERPPTPDPVMGEELGDIAISFDTCKHEANASDTPFEHHVTHLIVHATLHLLGYDHVRDGDATLMEGLEAEILGKMGLPDPYRK